MGASFVQPGGTCSSAAAPKQMCNKSACSRLGFKNSTFLYIYFFCTLHYVVVAVVVAVVSL